MLNYTEPEDLQLGLSDEKVETICRCIKTDFEGVISSRQLNKLKTTQKKKSVIVNVSSGIAGVPGHFIVLSCAKKRWTCFDPLALPLSWMRPVQRFLRGKTTEEKTKSQIQSLTSNRCGFFCIAYIWCKNLSLRDSEYVHLFHTSNLDQNDERVVFVLNFILRSMYAQKLVIENKY